MNGFLGGCWAYITLLFVIAITILSSCVSAQESAVVSGDGDILKGSSTQLSCSYTARNPTDDVSRLTWSFGPDLATAPVIGYYLINNPDVTYENGYGSPDYVISIDSIDTGSGSSVLTISSVNLDTDEGKYWCQVLVLGYPAFSDDYDTTVNALGTTQILYDEEDKEEIELMDGIYDFQCIVIGSKPASTITWTLGEEVQVETDRENTENADPRLTDSTSTLSVTINSEFGVKTLSCKATVPADGTGVSDTVQITRVDCDGNECNKPELSLGAIIGITVTCFVVVIGLIVSAAVVYKKKTSNGKPDAPDNVTIERKDKSLVLQ